MKTISCPPNHDVVVIGGSAGAVAALSPILASLPPDLPATVFVVVHVGKVSYLARALSQVSTLPVQPAESGATIEPGKVYVAVPGVHLMLHDHHILLRRGPRENFARPAIDPLFRSAAAAFSNRVIGVLLSGALSDGTAGLLAIKRCGGLCVVQDPEDAAVPDMPRSALRHVEIDHVGGTAIIGPLLDRLVREPAGPAREVPGDIKLEVAISAQELADMRVNDMLGRPSNFTCPECHGALWEIEDGAMLRFRCHTGHAFSAESVLSAEGDEIDVMLGRLQRAHQERAGLARRMAKTERTRNTALADQLEDRARGYEEDALLIRELMRRGVSGSTAGATAKRGVVVGNGEGEG